MPRRYTKRVPTKPQSLRYMKQKLQKLRKERIYDYGWELQHPSPPGPDRRIIRQKVEEYRISEQYNQ